MGEEMITPKKLDEIASLIAAKILFEDVDLAKTEKERQNLVVSRIKDDDLEAPANSKEKTITDEEDEEDEGDEGDDEKKDIEAKTKPTSDPDEDKDEKDFEVAGSPSNS